MFQAVPACRRLGLEVRASDFLNCHCIQGVAAHSLTTVAATITAEQGPVSGPVQLTPIMSRFLRSHRGRLHGYVQSQLFEVEGFDEARLQYAVNRVVAHHDMLRLRTDGLSVTILPADSVRVEIWDASIPDPPGLHLEDSPILRVGWIASSGQVGV